MESVPFVTSFDLIRNEAKLCSSTSTTYVYSKPVSSFRPRESFTIGGKTAEVMQPQDVFEHQKGVSLRCQRTRFTAFQRNELEKTFNQSQYISPWKRQSLSQELGIPNDIILTWFKNRRAKWRKEQQKSSPRSDDSCVSTGLCFHYFGHAPYPNSTMMMRDGQM